MSLVDVYDTKTGKKLPYQQPAHIVDHPVLGKRLSRIPSSTTKDAPHGPPTTDWTIAQLDEYAAANGIDLDGAKASKASRVAAIEEATAAGLNPAQTPDDHVQDGPSSTDDEVDTADTPAAGEN